MILNCNWKKIELNPKSNIVLIAFSSNGNDNEKFEFENILKCHRIKKYFNKIIFLRDQEHHFYINGINDSINNITKILFFLRQETKKYDIYAIGYSSGGYMAMLCGAYLSNVKRVYSFGGQINILDWHGSFCNYNFSDVDCVLKASEEQRQYFDISKKLLSFNPYLFGFYAGKAHADIPLIEQLKNVNSERIKIVQFNEDKHGSYNWSYDFKYLLTFSEKRLITVLNKFSGRLVSTKQFSFSLQKPLRFFYNNILRVSRYIIRKIKKQ